MRKYCVLFLLLTLTVRVFAVDILLDVPFVAQKKNGCGAAAIAMVLSYWNENGYPVDEESRNVDEILKKLFSKEYDGIRASDIERYFQQHRYRAFVFRGNIEDLQHHLSNGRPLVLALQQNQKAGLHHFVVATGISSDKSIILINDPAQRKLLKIDRDEFEKSWKDVDYWTLLAVPETRT